jgi:hypothetical protein
VKTWWWSSQLMADGHVFNNAEWRCSDCRIRVVDLLLDRPRCESPNNDGEFVFVGGPLDGEWRRVSEVTMIFAMPSGPPIVVPDERDDDEPSDDQPGFVRVTYGRSRMSRKGMTRYEFQG